MFSLGLERDGFLIPVINGGGNHLHGHDTAHKGRGNAHGEIPNKDILVGVACEGGVVFEVRDILDEGQ